jgi:hypothetical protein
MSYCRHDILIDSDRYGLGSILQLFYLCLSNVSNLIKASQKQRLEVREVFCANSIEDCTKLDQWLQLCQKTRILQK